MEENKKGRRKGRPLKKKEIPFNREVLNISLTLSVGLIVLFVLYSFFSKSREMINFSHDSAAQTAAAAAVILGESEESEKLFSEISGRSPDVVKETKKLTADEQTVVMSAFAGIEDLPEYKELKINMIKFKEIYPGTLRVALGIYDAKSGLLLLAADDKEKPGTVIRPEGFDDPDGMSHVVHKSFPGGEENLSYEAVVWFDSKHLYPREYSSLLLTTLAALVFAAVMCINAKHKADEYMKKQEFAAYKFYGADKADMKPELNLYPGIENPRDLYSRLMKIWCEYTCAPRLRENWSEDNKTLGQCSITAFLVQDIFGGEVRGIERESGSVHCYNVVDGRVFDLTSEQFKDEELVYSDTDPVQSREEHFAKEEKRLRYEYLKEKLAEEK